LAGLTASQILQTTIPFTNSTLGDELGFATKFANDVLNPLFSKPDMTVTTQTQGGGGHNEVQVVTVLNASDGPNNNSPATPFTPTVRANTTGPIAWNPDASTVQSALTGLASVGSNNVAVVRTHVTNGFQYTVTFQGGKANTNVSQITFDKSGLKTTADILHP